VFINLRGTEVVSAHGIPADLLDRLLIIKTLPYEPQDIATILTIRSKTEEIQVDEEALKHLAILGSETSLR
jgi:RuvB-like protein 1 (pontin 52)